MFLLIASLTAVLCFSNICDCEDAVHHAEDVDDRDTDDNQCSLSAWYSAVLAEGLLSGSYLGEEKESFRENVDGLLSADHDMVVNCRELESYYNQFMSWRNAEKGSKPTISSPLESSAILHGSKTIALDNVNAYRPRWLSTLDGCSSSPSHSRTVCYYVAICRRVCLHNFSHDDTHSKRKSDTAAIRKDISNHSNLSTTTTETNSANLVNQTKSLTTEADNVIVDPNRRAQPAAVPAVKSANSSTESNSTQQLLSKTTHIKGPETTTKIVDTTTKAKATTTSKNVDATPPPSDKASTTTTATATTPTDKSSNVKVNSSIGTNNTNTHVTSTITSRNTTHSKEPVAVVKSNTSTSSTDTNSNQKPIRPESKIDSLNSTSKTSVPSGNTVRKNELPARDETDLTESSPGDAAAAADHDRVKNGHNEILQDSKDQKEEAEKPSAPVESSNQSTSKKSHDTGDNDQYEQQLKLMEMKMLQLENQLLQSRVERTSSVTTTVQLENYILRLERQLMQLNNSFVELKAENGHLRQKHVDEAATQNASALASVGSQARKLAELIDFVNNQSSFLISLQDRYTELERDNKLLIEQVLNQSLMMNQIMLHVETLGRQQTEHTTQLMKLKQHDRDTAATPQSSATWRHHQSLSDHNYMFPDPPIYASSRPNSDVPKDCYGHYEGGLHHDAVLTIHPSQLMNDDLISVFCDMTERGWTVIQRRFDGSEDFYRSWNDYKVGFGNVDGEHWLGNDLIHLLTNQEHYSLRVSLTDWNSSVHVVEYDQFRVTDEADGYRLYVSGYHEDGRRDGIAGDSLIKHSGWRFSTFDVDNDQVDDDFEHGSCARRFSGAWWYYRCYMSNLNGRYYADGMVPGRLFDGIAWKSWTGSRYSLKRVEMKIRPSHLGRT